MILGRIAERARTHGGRGHEGLLRSAVDSRSREPLDLIGSFHAEHRGGGADSAGPHHANRLVGKEFSQPGCSRSLQVTHRRLLLGRAWPRGLWMSALGESLDEGATYERVRFCRLGARWLRGLAAGAVEIVGDEVLGEDRGQGRGPDEIGEQDIGTNVPPSRRNLPGWYWRRRRWRAAGGGQVRRVPGAPCSGGRTNCGRPAASRRRCR